MTSIDIKLDNEKGFGLIDKGDDNHTTARNASIGENIYKDYLDIYNDYNVATGYLIGRGLLPVDTEGISNNITSGYLHIYFDDCSYTLPNDQICIVETNQNSGENSTLTDYGRFNITIGGSINISTSLETDWHNISLNATGLSWLNKSGYTKLGLRTLSDINSSMPTGAGVSECTYICLNQNLTNSPPSLHLEYGGQSNISEFLSTAPTLYSALDPASIVNATFVITPTIAGEASKYVNATFNISVSLTSEILHQYIIEETLNLSTFIEATKEADYAIGDEHLPTPPKFKLLGYTVINEYGSPYIIAELKFQGTEIPSKDEYITLTQTDAHTGQKKIIFRGFPLEVSWKLKKDLVESHVKAVTNGWYLTQQMPSKWESSSLSYKEELNCQPWDPMYYYPRMNEIMLMWDWMNFIPDEDQTAEKDPDIIYFFEQDARGFNSYFTHWSAKGIATRWNLLTGVAPSYELAEEIGNIVTDYMPCSTPLTYDANCYIDIPDCKGVIDEPKEWAFDDFKTTKHDGIMQFCEYCDRIFHMRIAQTYTDLQQYQPHYGYYDKGTLVAYWTRNSSAVANSIEPFSVCLNITALTDNTLIEISKEERSTERTTPNVVKVGSIEPESYYTSDYKRNESSYPCDWWQKSTGEYTECGSYLFRPERPIEHFHMAENLSQNQVETHAQEMYERLQKGQDKYTASCLSIVCERASPYRCILPGSRIRVQNVSNHTDDELRIMRITHKKDGAKPAITEIEYYDVYDLAHPNIFPGSNIIERITAQSERNAEMGPRIKTYQNIKNPRKVGVGSQPFITPVEVTNVSSDLKVAEVRILNTSGKIKNVITW